MMKMAPTDTTTLHAEHGHADHIVAFCRPAPLSCAAFKERSNSGSEAPLSMFAPRDLHMCVCVCVCLCVCVDKTIAHHLIGKTGD